MSRNKWIGAGLTAVLLVVAGIYAFWEWQQAKGPQEIVIDTEKLEETLVDEPLQQYELIVVGGDPEGVAAAVSAARNGVKTLLIEHRDGLGGLFTYGWLNYLDLPQTRDGQILSKGIFAEWHDMMGEGNGFPVELAKKSFLSLVTEEEHLSLMLETDLSQVEMNEDGSQIKQIQVTHANKEHRLSADYFIDSTQDADLAAMADVPFFVGQEDLGFENTYMAVTPIIRVQNIDWDKIKRAAKEGIFGGAEVSGDAAWGFVGLHESYTPSQENVRLRGLNLVRVKTEKEENFYINALHVFGVDVLDQQSRQQGLQRGIEEFKHVLDFLQTELPGFAEAYIDELPTEMYVRESRHILTEYQLDVSDLWRNRDHWDSIGYGGYPADIQALSMDNVGYVVVNPDRYAIPFRSLVPLKVDNLLVASRSAGYSSLAAGSARIVPTGMVAGEAAGVATAVALEHGESFRGLSRDEAQIEQLRETLGNQGAWVEHFEEDYRYQDEFFDEALAYLQDHSIITTDYSNELYMEEPFNVKAFANMAINGLRQSPNPDPPGDMQQLASLYGWPNEQAVLKRDAFAQLMIDIFIKSGESGQAGSNETENDQVGAWAQAKQLGLIDEYIFERMEENRVLTRGEGFYITGNLLKHFINEDREGLPE